MARLLPLVMVIVFVGAVATRPAAQVGGVSQVPVGPQGQNAPPRDPTQGPQSRPFAVGGATLSGVVTAQDSGRPVRGARVTLNGTVTVPDGVLSALSAASRAGGAGAQPLQMNGPSPAAFAASVLRVNRTVSTDDAGRFVFAKLPAGRFTISVSKNPFLATSYGQKRFGGLGANVTVAENQEVRIAIPMMRGGVISGTIYNEDGEPASGVQVRSWRFTNFNGVKRLGSSGFAQTDDRGVYRMFNLQPGDYFVSATPANGDMMRMNNDYSLTIEQAIATGKVQPPSAPGLPSTVMVPPPVQNAPMQQEMLITGYLPVYFPNAPERANATSVHINGGEERAGTDINLRLVEAGGIRGTVSGTFKPGVSVQITLISDDTFAEGPSSTRIDPAKGTFNFRALAPGKYTLLAQTVPQPVLQSAFSGPVAPQQLDGADRLWDQTTVTIQGAITDVAMSLRAGRSISGRVLFDLAKPPVLANNRMAVMLGVAPGATNVSFGPSIQAPIEPDGSFKLTGVVPGQYVLRVNGATLKSAMVGGQDTLDFPLNFDGSSDIADAVLTATDKISELSGTLTEGLGKPASDYTVIAVATDQRFWLPGSRRIALARTGMDGRYAFRALPPGDYMLAVFEEFENGLQYDPEFLKTLIGPATRVTLPDGAKITQDLRVNR